MEEENNLEHEKQLAISTAVCSVIIAILSSISGAFDAVKDNFTFNWIVIAFSIILLLAMIFICCFRRCAEDVKRRYQIIKYACIAISALMILLAILSVLYKGAEPDGNDVNAWLRTCITGETPLPEPTPIPPISAPSDKIAAGSDFTILLKSDGRVQTFGDAMIDTSGWENIVQVAAYGDHAVGLCSNGKVVSTGCDSHGECDTSSWSDVQQVAACYRGTLGITSKGTVLYTGSYENNMIDCTKWKGVAKILGAEKHIVALTKRGGLLTVGSDEYGQLDIGEVSAIVTGVAANDSTFIVCAGGLVYEFGQDWHDEDEVSGWSDIVSIAGGAVHTVGLKKDGTVRSAGDNSKWQGDVSSWSNIVAICAGQYHTVGLCADGTLVATGLDDKGQCDVSGASYWAEN